MKDELTKQGIARYMQRAGLQLQVYRTIGSTNTALKEMAESGAPAGLALVAESQTAGRGRQGRSFYSPDGTGLYLSLLLRPALRAADAARLTAAAAVAAAEAIESVSGKSAQIKWVNDVYVDGRKVCGILTESALSPGTDLLRYAVVGVGINVFEPEGGFPAELQDIAGAVLRREDLATPGESTAHGSEQTTANHSLLRSRLAAKLLDLLAGYAEDPADPAIFARYKARSFLLGQKINILLPGREPEPAEAVGLSEDFALIVRLADGNTKMLTSGEVSIRERL